MTRQLAVKVYCLYCTARLYVKDNETSVVMCKSCRTSGTVRARDGKVVYEKWQDPRQRAL